MSEGYPKKSLIEKLGIKEGFKVFVPNPPKFYWQTLGELSNGVFMAKALRGPLDFIHFFTIKRDELERKFPILKRKLSKSGVLWISWPKSSSKVETDLNENIVREIGLKIRMIDVKVIALDESWSGLKFVYRTRYRK